MHIFTSSICVYNIYIYTHHIICGDINLHIYDAGLPHPPSLPPPHPMVSPLACQVSSCLVWRCCFPRLALFGLVPSPPPRGVGPVVFLVGPALPVCSTEVWYGCCRLLVVMSSLCALSPPPLCGAVCSTKIWYGCCPLVSSNVIVMCLVSSLPVWGSVFSIQRYGMVAVAC